ncbi:MAG: hypothetical protein ACLFPS_01635 [Clostridia bacterium]
MVGYIITFMLIVAVIYYSYSLVNKIKIDKKYVLKILSKVFPDESFDIKNVSIERTGSIKHEDTDIVEMAFYKVDAKSNKENTYSFELRRYNPEADIEAQEYSKFKKNAKAEDNVTESVLSGSPDAANTATIESAQSMLQEQSKREAEDKMIRARVLQHELGIKIARILSERSRLIPEVFYYDIVKYCTLIEYPGTQLLKDYLLNSDEDQKQQAVNKIINEIAKIHNTFNDISVYLPPRRDMEPEDFRGLLKTGLDSLYEARLISSQQRLELLNEYYTIGSFLSSNYLKNIKIEGVTPYKILVNKGNFFINEFYSYDMAPQLTNVVEFLKDPLIYDLELEKEAIASYYNQINVDMDYQKFMKYYHLFSCHILTIQLLYMKLYFKKIEEHRDEIEDEENILLNWDEKHFDMLYQDAKEKWQSFEESKFFIDKLDEIINAV